MHKTKNILSCDWGTSSFRLRLVNVDDGTILNEVKLEKGISAIYNEWLQSNRPETERINFYRAFLQFVFDKYFANNISGIPVIISGMASSTIGIKELNYKNLPFEISKNNLNTFLIKADENYKHDILLISGLKKIDDVMRGEETMLLGCNFRNDENAIVIFPGTHSKHVVVKNNVVTDFKTYMTGEFFELLSTKSLLAKSVIKNNMADNKSFIEGVKDGAGNNLLNASFHVRINQLFKKNTAEENYYYLSGLLIGNELSDLLKGKNQAIMIVANGELLKLYSSASKIINPSTKVSQQNADEVLIKAHILIYNHI
jgi:2-dehydro-3-deoxygalactonokinase